MEGDSSSSSTDAYKECLRNHAAALGTYATDGCGEFTSPSDSAALCCAACGCHRSFHRKVAASSASDPGRLEPSAAFFRKKRPRTKFTAEQKEKMLGFAEKLGWRLQRKEEEDEIERFCVGVGISRKVFKVWMHNHKNSCVGAATSTGNASSDLTHQ